MNSNVVGVMGLLPETFLQRLRSDKVVNCIYKRDEHAGLISAWAFDGRFVLTWEECLDGDQYNENAYTRDERHEFEAAEHVLAFVEQRGYPAAMFGP